MYDLVVRTQGCCLEKSCVVEKTRIPLMFDYEIQAKVSLIWNCCHYKEITYDLCLKTNGELRLLSHKWWTDAIIY